MLDISQEKLAEMADVSIRQLKVSKAVGHG